MQSSHSDRERTIRMLILQRLHQEDRRILSGRVMYRTLEQYYSNALWIPPTAYSLGSSLSRIRPI